MVAIYTSHVHARGQGLRQHQSLAYSNDQGRTWTRYDKNPILDIQRKDFRDPKVFWYDADSTWVMALVVPDRYKVQFYKSANLKEWKFSGEFGNAGDTLRIWECPDIFKLPAGDASGKTKWVLTLSGSHPSGPGYVGMQYFVGEFNGSTFIADDRREKALYVDYGKDFYAGIIFNNLPEEEGRTIMLGWANNWTYANSIPTSPWRGAMSLPRELTLHKTGGEFRLAQQPIRELVSLRGAEITDFENITSQSVELQLDSLDGNASLAVEDDSTGLLVALGTHGVKVARWVTGSDAFIADFSKVDSVVFESPAAVRSYRIFIDRSIVELFDGNGEIVLSEQFFTQSGKSRISVGRDGRTIYPSLSAIPQHQSNAPSRLKIRGWELQSAWKK